MTVTYWFLNYNCILTYEISFSDRWGQPQSIKAGFQHADISASADFYACADFLAHPHINFHHNADC